jgi:hypothetical protein
VKHRAVSDDVASHVAKQRFDAFGLRLRVDARHGSTSSSTTLKMMSRRRRPRRISRARGASGDERGRSVARWSNASRYARRAVVRSVGGVDARRARWSVVDVDARFLTPARHFSRAPRRAESSRVAPTRASLASVVRAVVSRASSSSSSSSGVERHADARARGRRDRTVDVRASTRARDARARATMRENRSRSRRRRARGPRTRRRAARGGRDG